MMKREDFPPGMPKETVDRLLAMSASTKPSAASVALLFAGTAGVVVVLVTLTRSMGWPSWIYGLTVPVTAGLGTIWQIFNARRVQKLVVEMGHTCPKCHKPLHSDTWSMAKAKAEREAMLQGYCPRCFDHVFPNLQMGIDEALRRAK
ncbi:MAG: hypothetical protein ACRENU_01105 [Gemmatimonadaceae bacterium]